MMAVNKNYLDISLLLLRLTFGGLMLINHGIGKWGSLFSGEEIRFADPIGLGMEASLYLAVFAEVLCAVLLVLGLFTRWAAIPLLLTMLVAAVIVHGGDSFADKEHAILFAIPYLILFLLGPGRFSIDAWWQDRKA